MEKETGEKKVKIEERIEHKTAVAAQLASLENENNLAAGKLNEAKNGTERSEAELYKVKADVKKSADHLQAVKSMVSKIVENVKKEQQTVEEMKVKEERLAKEHNDVLAMSENFANELMTKEEALQEVAARTKVLETDLKTMRTKLLEEQKALAALEVNGVGSVEAREVEARLEGLVSEMEKVKAELEEKEKAEEEQMFSIEKAEKETKSLKNQLTDMNKLTKEISSTLKNVNKLVAQNKNTLDMKLQEQEEARNKLEKLVVNVSRLKELQKTLTQDLAKATQDNEDTSERWLRRGRYWRRGWQW